MYKTASLMLQIALLQSQPALSATEALMAVAVAEDEIILCNVCDSELPEIASRRRVDDKPAGLRPLPATLPYTREIAAVAEELRVDAALIHAVVFVESAYRPQATSRKGAYGLMQLMPATAQQYSLTPGHRMSTRQHLQIGTRYLREMLDSFGGDMQLALAAYNAGPAAVQKHHGQIPPYAETRRYVPTVLYYYEQLKPRLARRQ